MINFEKISWKQVQILCKVIDSSSSFNIKTIKRWYESESVNFEDTLIFLVRTNTVKVKNNKLFLSQNFKKIVGLDEDVKKKFFADLLLEKNTKKKYLQDFFSNFESSGRYYKFVPTTQERLKYSGIRNFLIDLNVLEFEPSLCSYSIKKNLVRFLDHKNKRLPYSQFQKILESEKELGLATELFVYKQEKNIFKNRPDIQRKILHVSLMNVMAGYDIKSYEKQSSGKLKPKYIEVKAVSPHNWKFYWSRNEINKAKHFGNNYYLYLIPVNNGETLNIKISRQIKNPHEKVFLNHKEWTQEIENTSFWAKY